MTTLSTTVGSALLSRIVLLVLAIAPLSVVAQITNPPPTPTVVYMPFAWDGDKPISASSVGASDGRTTWALYDRPGDTVVGPATLIQGPEDATIQYVAHALNPTPASITLEGPCSISTPIAVCSFNAAGIPPQFTPGPGNINLKSEGSKRFSLGFGFGYGFGKFSIRDLGLSSYRLKEFVFGEVGVKDLGFGETGVASEMLKRFGAASGLRALYPTGTVEGANRTITTGWTTREIGVLGFMLCVGIVMTLL